jgi:large subunit ribosomal protein L3
MSAILGRKVGMTSVFDGQGNQVVCTVVEAGPLAVTQLKTDATDGYQAVQVGYGTRKAKRTTKAMQGHFEAAGVEPKQHLLEFRDFPGLDDLSLGQELLVGDLFAEGDTVEVSGKSKGKGFQGVVKRHNFRGVNDATHGQHNRQRAPGSIGQASDPSRVFKGVRMAGRDGNRRVTVKNLRVVRIMPEQNLMLIKGALPGHKNAILEIRKKTA